ncbi:hypothetical protein SNEBB_007552 [Seison nebaliae]|nr:hypothetical protein SNEBB_007552 [Seison nebaliae]
MVSIGLTVENLLYRLIGDQYDNFVMFHIRRSFGTIVIHLFCPFIYGIISMIYHHYFWTKYLLFISTTSLLLMGIFIYLNEKNNYKKYLKKLFRLTDNHINEINEEIRDIEKFISGTDNRQLIVTSNWIINTFCYGIRLSKKTEMTIQIISDCQITALIDHQTDYTVETKQMLNLKLIPKYSSNYHFRIKGNQFESLKEMMSEPILNIRNILIHLSVADEFILEFTQQIQQNPTVRLLSEDEIDTCPGCMMKNGEIKLHKNCTQNGNCGNCRCRPIWCIDCMGRWFASRQVNKPHNQWLSSSASCPMCRKDFCILDVCPIQLINEQNERSLQLNKDD